MEQDFKEKTEVVSSHVARYAGTQSVARTMSKFICHIFGSGTLSSEKLIEEDVLEGIHPILYMELKLIR